MRASEAQKRYLGSDWTTIVGFLTKCRSRILTPQRACNIEHLFAWLKNAASAPDKTSFNFCNLYRETLINRPGAAPVVLLAYRSFVTARSKYEYVFFLFFLISGRRLRATANSPQGAVFSLTLPGSWPELVLFSGYSGIGKSLITTTPRRILCPP